MIPPSGTDIRQMIAHNQRGRYLTRERVKTSRRQNITKASPITIIGMIAAAELMLGVPSRLGLTHSGIRCEEVEPTTGMPGIAGTTVRSLPDALSGCPALRSTIVQVMRQLT